MEEGIHLDYKDFKAIEELASAIVQNVRTQEKAQALLLLRLDEPSEITFRKLD